MDIKFYFFLRMRMMQTRYALMLEDQEDAIMDVVEVDDELAIKTCKHYNYKYAVITPDDIVIPPKMNDNLQED
jgi:hypothetical protein